MVGLITSFFAFVDKGIYMLAAKMFNLIFFMADIDIFTDTAISGFTKRVYIILGVVILFKIIISCVQYLINPDQMSDKEKGFGSLIQKTVISIALLALVPTIFDFAKSLQRTVSSAIPAVVLNANIQTDSVNIDYNEQVGNWMSFTVLTSFIEAKENVNVSDAPISDFNSFNDNIVSGCGWSGFESSCKYNYQWYFSIPCGIFLIYILLSMGLDIAIRTIKLGLLEILAPIPIASYIDNKKSFDKWKDLSIKVYLDLFVRLIVIYIVIYVLNIIATGGISFGSAPTGYQPFIVIYIILALLMFAKSAPKFICDILGIDSKGEGIGEMFKPAWSRAGGLAAGAGMLTAGIGNAANSLKGWKNMSGVDRVKALRDAAKSGVSGAASAGFHGGIAALQGKSGKDVMAAGHKRAIQARINKGIDDANHVHARDRFAARVNDFFGLDTDASLAEGRQKAFATVHQDVGNYKKAVMGRIVKEAGNVSIRTSNASGSAMMDLGQLLADSRSEINQSGNVGLMSALNKFNLSVDANGRTTCLGLKDGMTLTYSELRAIGIDAQQAGIGKISDRTNENGDITLKAQKELFSDAMTGKVYQQDGKTLHDTINVMVASKDENGNIRRNRAGQVIYEQNKDLHVDISTIIGQAKQHITENSLSLGTVKDVRVTRVDSDTGEEKVVTATINGAEDLANAFMTDFSKLDDQLQRRSAEVASEISRDKNAAARASIQRRDANNKK